MSNEAEVQLPTIADDLVVTKYKMAAEIVNRKHICICISARFSLTIPLPLKIPLQSAIYVQSRILGALKETIKECVEGKSVRELCAKADTLLEEETGKAFKKDKKVQKGNVLAITSKGLCYLLVLF